MHRNERNWGRACHLSALAGYVVPFGWILGPLVCWLVKREEYPFVDQNGKEALNFQISVLIYGIIAVFLSIILIGIPILIALGIFQLIMIIIASVRTSNGESYRYPLTIRFLK